MDACTVLSSTRYLSELSSQGKDDRDSTTGAGVTKLGFGVGRASNWLRSRGAAEAVPTSVEGLSEARDSGMSA